MKLFCNYAKLYQRKSIMHMSLNGSSLVRIHKFKFGDISQEQKSLEFSDLDETPTNPLLKSISESEAFKNVAPDPTKRKRRADVDQRAWRKQQRELEDWGSFGPYSALYGARSVEEIRDLLASYKENYVPQKQESRKERIMDILSSIADESDKADSDIDEDNDVAIKSSEKSEKSEKENIITKGFGLANAYSTAITICGLMKEFDEGFKLFEEAKQDKKTLNPNVFSSAMWLTMEQNFDYESYQKCWEIVEDMKNNYNLKPSAKVYKELINGAVHLRNFRSANSVMREVFELDEDVRNKMLSSRDGKLLRVAIVNYYAKTRQIEQGLKFMNMLVNKIGQHALDDNTYSSMLSGIALVVKREDKSMVDAAEKLFQQSFQVLGRPPKDNVFSALLTVYANVPDVHSCLDILKTMYEHDTWPNPSSFAYSASLKSIVNHYYDKGISYEEGWKLANEMLDLMKKHNVETHESQYAILFNMCGGSFCGQSNIDKLYELYDEMMKEDISPNPSTLNSLLMSGVDHFGLKLKENPGQRESIKKDIMKYIDWALLQFKQHRIKLTAMSEDKLQQKLNNIL